MFYEIEKIEYNEYEFYCIIYTNAKLFVCFCRYKWEHCVLREDITSRRICLAYRELTPPYLYSSANNQIIEELLKRASVFQWNVTELWKQFIPVKYVMLSLYDVFIHLIIYYGNILNLYVYILSPAMFLYNINEIRILNIRNSRKKVIKNF